MNKIAGLLLALYIPSSHAQDERGRILDDQEARQVKGGVSADITWPTGGPWYQSYDNLRFDMQITNGYGTDTASVQAYAGSTKTAWASVSTLAPDYEGRWHTRTLWPVSGQHDLQIKYTWEGETFNAVGESLLADQYLHPDVKVHTVKFWNTTSPTMSTQVSSTLIEPVLDSLDPAIPNRFTNVDGIYAESCGTLTKTQWRFVGIGTMEISDECMDMVNSGRTNASCIEEMYENYSDDPDNVHVVWVKSNQNSGWAGAHVWQGSNSGPYTITIRDDWAGAADLDALLAHEFGHTYIGGHPPSGSAADIACQTLARADREVMCSNVGRVMTTTACSAAENSNRYPNRN